MRSQLLGLHHQRPQQEPARNPGKWPLEQLYLHLILDVNITSWILHTSFDEHPGVRRNDD
jgi:hypothetical protein